MIFFNAKVREGWRKGAQRLEGDGGLGLGVLEVRDDVGEFN